MLTFNWVLDSIDTTHSSYVSGYSRGHKHYRTAEIKTYHLHRDKDDPNYLKLKQLEELFLKEEKFTHQQKEKQIEFDPEKFLILLLILIIPGIVYAISIRNENKAIIEKNTRIDNNILNHLSKMNEIKENAKRIKGEIK